MLAGGKGGGLQLPGLRVTNTQLMFSEMFNLQYRATVAVTNEHTAHRAGHTVTIADHSDLCRKPDATERTASLCEPVYILQVHLQAICKQTDRCKHAEAHALYCACCLVNLGSLRRDHSSSIKRVVHRYMTAGLMI